MEYLEQLIEVKADAPLSLLAESGLLPFWQEKQQRFLANLRATSLKAVILDYDGTVYAGGQRHNAFMDADMATLLTGLLEGGLFLGFASGRGLSLRDALRPVFAKELWPRIYVAYQDGAEIGRLDDDSLPTPYNPEGEHPSLARARETLAGIFQGWPDPPTMRAENMLLGVYGPAELGRKIFAACCGAVLPLGLKVFHAGRMTDITLPQVSKSNLARSLPQPALAIGDAGAWPGNDCEMLAHPLGISVGSVSVDADTCWRLTMQSGVAATGEILRHLTLDGAGKGRLCF